MGSIELYRPGRMPVRRRNRLDRRTATELDRVDSDLCIGLAQIEGAAEIQVAKTDAVAFVGRRAMQDVALLSQVEMQLAQAVPHASGRLASIADLTAIALTEVVVDAARRIGR